jgi:hypothetical protein
MLNINEVEQMVEIAADAKVDILEFSITDAWSDKITPYIINQDNHQLFIEAQNKIEKRAKQLGVTLHFYQPLYLNFANKEELKQKKRKMELKLV